MKIVLYHEPAHLKLQAPSIFDWCLKLCPPKFKCPSTHRSLKFCQFLIVLKPWNGAPGFGCIMNGPMAGHLESTIEFGPSIVLTHYKHSPDIHKHCPWKDLQVTCHDPWNFRQATDGSGSSCCVSDVTDVTHKTKPWNEESGKTTGLRIYQVFNTFQHTHLIRIDPNWSHASHLWDGWQHADAESLPSSRPVPVLRATRRAALPVLLLSPPASQDVILDGNICRKLHSYDQSG